MINHFHQSIQSINFNHYLNRSHQTLSAIIRIKHHHSSISSSNIFSWSLIWPAFSNNCDWTASIFCSWRLLSGYFFFEINGSEGYINVDGRFDTHGGDKIFWLNKKNNKILSKDFSHIKPQSYKLEMEKFIETVTKKKKPSPSARDGLEVMRMIDFIYSSSKK